MLPLIQTVNCNSKARTVPGVPKRSIWVPFGVMACSCCCPAAGLLTNAAGHARDASCQMPCGCCAGNRASTETRYANQPPHQMLAAKVYSGAQLYMHAQQPATNCTIQL
jgi:hypothetical protein